MRRFVDEIIVENPELINPIVRGLECFSGYEVELRECGEDPLESGRRSTDRKYRASLKIFKVEAVD